MHLFCMVYDERCDQFLYEPLWAPDATSLPCGEPGGASVHWDKSKSCHIWGHYESAVWWLCPVGVWWIIVHPTANQQRERRLLHHARLVNLPLPQTLIHHIASFLTRGVTQRMPLPVKSNA